MGEGPKDLRDDATRDPRTRDEIIGGPLGDDVAGRPLTSLDRPGASEAVGYAGAMPTTGSASYGGTSSGDATARSGDTAAIRAEIEQTRSNISETVEAIQQKLSPSNIVSQATGSVREATRERARRVADAASETASRVADTTRQVSSRAMDTARQVSTRAMHTARHVSTRAVDSARHASARAVDTARENPWATAAAVAGVGALAYWLMSRRGTEYDDGYELEAFEDETEESLYSEDDYEFEDEGTSLMDRMRGNAIPLVVAGVGIGWWLYSRQSGDRSSFAPEYTSDTNDVSWSETSGYGADAGGYRSFSDERGWTDTASEAADRVKGAVSSAADRARDAMADAGGRAKGVMNDVSARTRHLAARASTQVTHAGRRAGSQLSYWMDRNPLAVGAAAMALGAAVGMALPETRRERRMMGGARDRLFERAQNMAGEAVDRAKQTVQEVASKATDAMSQAGQGQQSNQQPPGGGFGNNPR